EIVDRGCVHDWLPLLNRTSCTAIDAVATAWIDKDERKAPGIDQQLALDRASFADVCPVVIAGLDPAIHRHAKRRDPQIKPAGDTARGIGFTGIRAKNRSYAVDGDHMQKILITGAAGDVGTRLTALLSDTYRLRLSDVRMPASVPPDTDFIAADLS